MLNLPHEERYKEKNVAIVGILPGQHEPSKHVKIFEGAWINIEGTSEQRFCSLGIL
jgi:hypothetical protein